MARCPCPHSLRPATAPRPRPLSTPLIPVRHDAGQWPDAPKPFGVIVPRLRVRVMARTWTWRRVEHRSSARRAGSRRRQPDPVSGSGRTVPGRSAASTHPGTRRHTSCRSVRARPAIPPAPKGGRRCCPSGDRLGPDTCVAERSDGSGRDGRRRHRSPRGGTARPAWCCGVSLLLSGVRCRPACRLYEASPPSR